MIPVAFFSEKKRLNRTGIWKRGGLSYKLTSQIWAKTEKIQCFSWENRRETRFRAPQAQLFSPAALENMIFVFFNHFRDRFLKKAPINKKALPFTPKLKFDFSRIRCAIDSS